MGERQPGLNFEEELEKRGIRGSGEEEDREEGAEIKEKELEKEEVPPQIKEMREAEEAKVISEEAKKEYEKFGLEKEPIEITNKFLEEEINEEEGKIKNLEDEVIENWFQRPEVKKKLADEKGYSLEYLSAVEDKEVMRHILKTSYKEGFEKIRRAYGKEYAMSLKEIKELSEDIDNLYAFRVDLKKGKSLQDDSKFLILNRLNRRAERIEDEIKKRVKEEIEKRGLNIEEIPEDKIKEIKSEILESNPEIKKELGDLYKVRKEFTEKGGLDTKKWVEKEIKEKEGLERGLNDLETNKEEIIKTGIDERFEKMKEGFKEDRGKVQKFEEKEKEKKNLEKEKGKKQKKRREIEEEGKKIEKEEDKIDQERRALIRDKEKLEDEITRLRALKEKASAEGKKRMDEEIEEKNKEIEEVNGRIERVEEKLEKKHKKYESLDSKKEGIDEEISDIESKITPSEEPSSSELKRVERSENLEKKYKLSSEDSLYLEELKYRLVEKGRLLKKTAIFDEGKGEFLTEGLKRKDVKEYIKGMGLEEQVRAKFKNEATKEWEEIKIGYENEKKKLEEKIKEIIDGKIKEIEPEMAIEGIKKRIGIVRERLWREYEEYEEHKTKEEKGEGELKAIKKEFGKGGEDILEILDKRRKKFKYPEKSEEGFLKFFKEIAEGMGREVDIERAKEVYKVSFLSDSKGKGIFSRATGAESPDGFWHLFFRFFFEVFREK